MTIRLATVEDAAAVRDIYAPAVRDTVISFEFVEPDVSEMAHRIEVYSQKCPWLVYEMDGQVVGYAYANPHRAREAYQWSAEVSAYIHADHRRKGIGRALYTCLLDLLRLQGYRNAYAGVTLPNEGSVGLHEAMGFTPVGVYKKVGYKFGAWHDVGWWQLELQPLTDNPTPPLKPADMIDSVDWQQIMSRSNK